MDRQLTEPIDRVAVERRWHDGMPPQQIAVEVDCSVSSVYRIAREECWDRPTDQARELFVARQYAERIAADYRKGIGIDALARKYDLPPHIVRAAVYVATEDGLPTGLVLVR